MKKFIAFTTNSNSGIKSKDDVIAWANTQLAQKQNLIEVHVAEVIEVVERTVPTTQIRRFFLNLDGEPVAKTI